MHTSSTIRKVFEGVATRAEMHRMFNRHRGNPAMAEGDARHLFAGEWFEIAESEYDYMLELLPPLWMRADMFAMRELMTASVTSVFLSLSIDGQMRWFHGYCDLSDRASPERMKATIIERESRPVRAMTRVERLEHARDTAIRAESQANRLYRFGRTDLLSLLTVQANLATAEATLASSDASVADRRIDVFLALGGGW